MVEAQFYTPAEAFVGRIILRPNNSLTWRAAKWFLAGLAGISFTIAAMFLWQGYWVILPFTAIEMSIIALCFRIIARRTRQQQIIAMSADELVFETGANQVERRYVWERFFTRILISQPPHPWHAVRIEVRHRNETIELGQFLAGDEKQELAKLLRSLVLRANAAQGH